MSERISECERERNEGNEAFKLGQFRKASKAYNKVRNIY